MLPLKWQEGRQPRRLLCFSAAFFVVAVVFSLLFSQTEALKDTVLYSGIAALVLAMGVILLLREQFRIASSVLIGLLIGWLWCSGYGILIWQPTQEYDGVAGHVRLELTEYAQGYESYGVTYGIISELDGEDCHLKVKAYLQDGSPEFSPGDVLLFRGEINSIKQDFSRNLLQEGYYLTVSQVSDLQVLRSERVTLLRQMRILSRQITQRIQMLLPGDEGALLAALLSGERNSFSEEFDQALTTSGTRHITAVSGLHISILAGILIHFFGKRRGLLLSVFTAVTYAAIVGFSPSVVRAVILLIFWSVSFFLKEEKDSLTALAAALLLLTAWNPFSSISAGLLLSFAATLGLILLSAPLNTILNRPFRTVKRKWLKKGLDYLAGTISATFAATMFTMPLNLLFFETVPLLGLLSNLLILWAVSIVMVSGCIVLILSLFLPGLACILTAWVLRWPLWWIVSVIRVIGSFPFAATDSANLLIAGCSLFILIGLLLWRGRMLSGSVLLDAAAIILCVTVLFSIGERKIFGVAEVYNSGGQPIILLRNEGVSMINCGARSDYAYELLDTALSRWNAVQPETILCTTGNYKTQAGLMAVLDRITPTRLVLPAETGRISARYVNVKPYTFTDTGTLTVSGNSIQLLKASDETFAVRLHSKRFSFLSLCGIKGEAAVSLVQEQLCSADILVVDDSLMNDWQTMFTICNSVQPKQILLVSAGYSEYGESFASIPVVPVERQAVRFYFWR